jgi:hypothetical protein
MARCCICMTLVVFALGARPSAADEPKLQPPDRAIEQVIDHYIDAGLKDANLTPAVAARPNCCGG